jgi:hypothetical protein
MRGTPALVAAICLVIGGCSGGRERPKRPAPGNKPATGFIDAPQNGTDVRPRFTVAGWALDPDGIREIRVYLDDELVASAKPAVARPDVARIWESLAAANPLPGWMIEVDAGSRLGYKTIRAEAVDNAGALSWFAASTVSIKPYGLPAK